MAPGGYQDVRSDDDAWFRSCGRLDDGLCFFFCDGRVLFFSVCLDGWIVMLCGVLGDGAVLDV